MDTLFFIQGIVIIVGLLVTVFCLLFITLTTFLDNFLAIWKERKSRERREWEQRIELRVEQLEKQQKK